MHIGYSTYQNPKPKIAFFLSYGDKLSLDTLNLSIKTSIWCHYDTKTESKKSIILPYWQGYSSGYVLGMS